MKQELFNDVDDYMSDLNSWKKRKLIQEKQFKEEELKISEEYNKEIEKMLEKKYEIEEDEVEKEYMNK